MPAALTIATKDLRLRVRDRSALILGVGAPLVLAIIFSLISGGTDLHGRFEVVDQDEGDIASNFLSGPGASLVSAGLADVTAGETLATASDNVKAGTTDAAFIFPAGFSSSVSNGEPAELELLVPDRRSYETLLAGGVARSFLSSIERTRLSAATALAVENLSLSDPKAQALSEAAARTTVPTSVTDDYVELRQVSLKTSYVAGMAAFFVFLTVQFSFLSLHSERAEGTLSRLLASPIRPRDILLGKALVGFVLGLTSMAILVLVSIPLLGAKWGSPGGVALLMVGITVAAMGIMGAAATFAHTYEQANSIGTVVAVVLGIVGGSFFPTYLGPDFMAQLSLATPHTWWVRGLGDLSPSGSSFGDALPAAAVLFGFGLTTGTFAVWRARKMLSQ